jgi:O-antigen/teichoic acid export membrane protein
MALPERLDVLGTFDGALGFHSTRVVDVLWLEQQDPDLLFGDGSVLDALRHDDDLARSDFHLAVAEFHGHPPPNHMEQLVLLIVGVPQEFPLNLGELDVLAVELGNDLWGPLILKQTKLFGERNGVHDGKVGDGPSWRECYLRRRAEHRPIDPVMLKRMATLLGGSLAGQLVTIAAAFILTRLYSPEAFAHLEMFALVTGIAAVLGTGKYEQALMLPKAESEARVLFVAGQRAVGITVFVVFVLATLSASWVSTRYGLEHWTFVAYALPLFCAFAAHARLMEYWHHRNADAGKVATAQAAGPLASEGVKLALAGPLSMTGLVWGSAIGIGIRWATMRRGLTDIVRDTWAWHRVKDDTVLADHRDYPTWVLAGSAMNRLAQWLHVLLIGATLGPVLLGMMGLARRMIMQPLSLLATSSAPVLFQGSTEVEDGAPLRALFLRALGAFAVASALVWVVVMLAPGHTTAWLFGAEWFGAMDVVRILTPWFVLNFMTAGLGALFHRVRKPRWITWLDGLHLLAVGLGWYLGTIRPEWFGGGEWGALIGIVWAKCIYYVLNLAVLITAVLRHGK